MTTTKKRTIALAICLLFFGITVFSLFYIAKEADHECTGEDCPVCACIHQAQQTLKNIGTGIALAAAVVPVLFVVRCLSIPALILPYTCLVQQKVRLDC